MAAMRRFYCVKFAGGLILGTELCVVGIGCRSSNDLLQAKPAATTQPALAEMVRTELYFGRSQTDGGQVSDQQWEQFIEEEVTPRFPDGYTVVDGSGHWRLASGATTRESSKLLILIHSAGPDADAKIEDIRAAYRDRFKQESVLRSDERARVEF
jgi:hypothetical protein